MDGGGTGSRAMVGDARGRALGSAQGGPGLIDPANPRSTAEAVAATVRAAARRARVALPARGLWAGLAGAGQLEARASVEAALRQMGLAVRTAVGTDVEAAHADAFGMRPAAPGAGPPASPSPDGGPLLAPGIVCVAGTGSSVRAVGPQGEVVQVGGWGALLGDEGSGYRMGLDGLRAVMRASDGREARTSLSAALLDAVGVGAPDDLVGWSALAAKPEIAALSVPVAAQARRGDPVAARIVHRALGAIRAHLEAALERTTGWERAPVVAFVGGLVRKGSPLHQAANAIAEELGCVVHADPVVPERGALRLARASW